MKVPPAACPLPVARAVRSSSDSPSPRAAPSREALKAPVGKSAKAFTLHERDLIPEGIAHDPASGAFFVSA